MDGDSTVPGAPPRRERVEPTASAKRDGAGGRAASVVTAIRASDAVGRRGRDPRRRVEVVGAGGRRTSPRALEIGPVIVTTVVPAIPLDGVKLVIVGASARQ